MILLVAIDSKGGMSRDGKIPWNCPQDLRNLYQRILWTSVLMGSKTFKNMNKVKLGSCSEVGILSRKPSSCFLLRDRFKVYHSISEVELDRVDYLLGGSQVYSELMSFCEGAIISHVEGDFQCDVKFPLEHFNSLFEEDSKEGKISSEGFTEVKYRRRVPKNS